MKKGRANPGYGGKMFTDEESRRIVGELAVMATLRAPGTTIEDIFLVSALIPPILATLHKDGKVKAIAIASAEECRCLIDGLDALFRETGQKNEVLRELMVNSAYGELPKG